MKTAPQLQEGQRVEARLTQQHIYTGLRPVYGTKWVETLITGFSTESDGTRRIHVFYNGCTHKLLQEDVLPELSKKDLIRYKRE
jgi:hypothetical protein